MDDIERLKEQVNYLKDLLKLAANMLPTYVGPAEKPEINTAAQELYYLIQDAISDENQNL